MISRWLERTREKGKARESETFPLGPSFSTLLLSMAVLVIDKEVDGWMELSRITTVKSIEIDDHNRDEMMTRSVKGGVTFYRNPSLQFPLVITARREWGCSATPSCATSHNAQCCDTEDCPILGPIHWGPSWDGRRVKGAHLEITTASGTGLAQSVEC